MGRDTFFAREIEDEGPIARDENDDDACAGAQSALG
jgi:hypothetical protein